jgi:K+-transporting ATPase KdpF subunit
MKALIISGNFLIQSEEVLSNNAISYIIGGLVAFLILGYLIYTLFRPEKF